MKTILAVALIAITLGYAAGHITQSNTGKNWPQWRGPEGDGSSKAKGLPVTWGPDKNIVWKTPLPSWSGGTPIVWGERIFLTSASKPAPSTADSGAETQAVSQEGQGRRRGGGFGGGYGQ